MKYRSNFLKAKDVADWLDVSESAIYKWVNEGNFPKPYKFGKFPSFTHIQMGKRGKLSKAIQVW